MNFTRLLHKLLGYLSKVAPKIFKSCPKVAHFTKKLLKSCFFSTQKNQFLLLIKVNPCTSIRIMLIGSSLAESSELEAISRLKLN